MEQLKSIIQQAAEQHRASLVDIRQHLHKNPELSFQEFNTARFIAKTLQASNITVQEGVANTGLVVTIKGNHPSNKIIALRADIDALPIQEENNVSYKSTVPGVMHACGHDVHTTSLIGTAWILDQLRDHFGGTVRLIFQPAEEKIPGGAIAMIREGVLQNPVPSLIIGQHVSPQIPIGQAGVAKGVALASTDELYFTIRGKGGHAASPHLAVDPIVVAAHLILALQQIISRNRDPIQPGVLSICQVNAGTATNIIPETVELTGTLRTANETWRSQTHERITQLSHQLAESMGASCEVKIAKGYPSLYNDPILTEHVFSDIQAYLGPQHIQYVDMNMAAEDFAYYAKEIPGCFYLIGVQNKQMGIDSFVHTPTFDVDETVLNIAPGLMAWLALKCLERLP